MKVYNNKDKLIHSSNIGNYSIKIMAMFKLQSLHLIFLITALSYVAIAKEKLAVEVPRWVAASKYGGGHIMRSVNGS